MEFLIGTVLAALVVTVGVAKLIAVRRPATPFGLHVACAAMSFPVVAILMFVVATVFTLAQPVSEPGGTTGMVVFAFVFFLIYAIGIGAVIGLPAAFVAVRSFRKP